jgi:hypothetical protein
MTVDHRTRHALRAGHCHLRLPGWALAALLLLPAPAALGQFFDQGPVFTCLEENDFIVRTDRHYTQGLKFSYLQRDNVLPGFLKRFSDRLPAVGFEKKVDKFGYQAGQSIFTPNDLDTAAPLPGDRPYAGWLYTGFILQRRGLTGRFPVLEHLQMDLGVIGPEALAEQAQDLFHGTDANGWDNQLGTEFGLAVRYQRAWLLSPQLDRRGSARWLDLIPHAGFSLGNIETSFRCGGTVRVGWNLPDDFGVQSIDALATTDGGWSPSRKAGRYGAYLFTGVEGRAVAYSAFLDGNLFRDSLSVDKETLVGEWKSGLIIVLNRLELGYTYILRSKEFHAQDERDRYGSAFLKYKF